MVLPDKLDKVIRLRYSLSLLLLLVTPVLVFSQSQSLQVQFDWEPVQKIHISENDFQSRLNFTNASYSVTTPSTPHFEKKIALNKATEAVNISIQNPKFQPLTAEEILVIDNILAITDRIDVKSNITINIPMITS